MQKIIPFLWFDNNAEEAVKFYTSVFKNSKTGFISRYDETSAKVANRPVGSVLTIDFTLDGMEFGALNGGPIFKFNPAISFMVHCKNKDEVDYFWEKFSKGAKILMPLDKYPFSEWYGWLEDKFGLSWQFIVADSQSKIVPSLMFTQKQAGKAKEAMDLYTSLINNSKIDLLVPYEKSEKEVLGAHKYAQFTLGKQNFIAMDSSMAHAFSFTHAISFLVNCDDQKEINYLSENLSNGGAQEPCGWLLDKYGVSWQIVPKNLRQMLQNSDSKKAKAVSSVLFTMQKLDVKKLTDAFNK